jgi:hypothetical protein
VFYCFSTFYGSMISFLILYRELLFLFFNQQKEVLGLRKF